MSKTDAFDRMCSCEINGKLTNFVFKRFRNKFFVVITQYQKMPNVYTVRFEGEQIDFMMGGLPAATPTLNIINNFGADTDEVRSAVKFVVSNSKLKRGSMEILISVGLHEINGDCLKKVVKVLDTLL